MTASIKRREDKLCDRKDYVETKKLNENKEEQLRQLKEHWKRRETKSRPEKDRLKGRRRYRIWQGDALMDKRATV